MQDEGIARVCCLLENELENYEDLLGIYRQAFGDEKVAHVPIEDHKRIEPQEYWDCIFPFLAAADAMGEPVVLHCSAGSGRTGHVLVLFLVSTQGYDLDKAIQTVEQSGLTPLESVGRDELNVVIEVHHAFSD